MIWLKVALMLGLAAAAGWIGYKVGISGKNAYAAKVSQQAQAQTVKAFKDFRESSQKKVDALQAQYALQQKATLVWQHQVLQRTRLVNSLKEAIANAHLDSRHPFSGAAFERLYNCAATAGACLDETAPSATGKSASGVHAAKHP